MWQQLTKIASDFMAGFQAGYTGRDLEVILGGDNTPQPEPKTKSHKTAKFMGKVLKTIRDWFDHWTFLPEAFMAISGIMMFKLLPTVWLLVIGYFSLMAAVATMSLLAIAKWASWANAQAV